MEQNTRRRQFSPRNCRQPFVDFKRRSTYTRILMMHSDSICARENTCLTKEATSERVGTSKITSSSFTSTKVNNMVLEFYTSTGQGELVFNVTNNVSGQLPVLHDFHVGLFTQSSDGSAPAMNAQQDVVSISAVPTLQHPVLPR
ncbi:hypothetical protein V7S43_002533 [Phytophthora oleae]|uniref:Uncharacterized protein n=1 Tax=Phytophthora oleae TaxID=2107226 RepID=A0ABD3FY73_9STRA